MLLIVRQHLTDFDIRATGCVIMLQSRETNIASCLGSRQTGGQP